MADLLMRDMAPLAESEWTGIDELVAHVVERRLVGRRILPLFGPLGAGMQTVPVDRFAGIGPDTSDGPVRKQDRRYIELHEISKEFVLNWRDIQTAHAGHLPLELSPAAAAASVVAIAEDRLVFRGDEALGMPGLMNVEGRIEAPKGDWVKSGAFGDITAAIRVLQENACPGPYALVVSPSGFAQMQRPYANTGALEISLVRELMADGVYQTPILAEGEALVIGTGAQNADLAVGVDLSVAYVEQSGLDAVFRIFETLALRIKRPNCLCTITGK